MSCRQNLRFAALALGLAALGSASDVRQPGDDDGACSASDPTCGDEESLMQLRGQQTKLMASKRATECADSYNHALSVTWDPRCAQQSLVGCKADGVNDECRYCGTEGTPACEDLQATLQDPWADDGSFFGYLPSYNPSAPTQAQLTQVYGMKAMQKARGWVTSQKSLWCGSKEDPDGTVPPGDFPFIWPTTNETFWPGACPNSKEAQEVFDRALAFRMLFNDNEAACHFQGAVDIDQTCSMAALAKAYSMGPNVNYAELASPAVYLDILTSLAQGRDILESSGAPQSKYAPAFYAALREFYCVPEKGALDAMLAVARKSPAEAYDLYKKSMTSCTHEWALAISSVADAYPGDPNLQAIAAGALMQDPAWKWWDSVGQNSSLIVGALANTSAAAEAVDEQTIMQASGKVKDAAAIANTMIQRALGVAPNHLGGLHFLIHNMEQGPYPVWGESVADSLYKNSQFQGHAIHMQTHIATRIGRWVDSVNYNMESVTADTIWNINRTGGGIQSLLYKYVPHNAAFAAEASQHGFAFKELAAACSMVNYCASFGLLADPSMGSLANFLKNALQRPLRFGKYEELLVGTGPGGNANLPVGATEARLYLPDKVYTSSAQTVMDALNATTLYVRTVSQARTGRVAEAVQGLEKLLDYPGYNPPQCFFLKGNSTGLYDHAEFLADCLHRTHINAMDEIQDSKSSMATGTLTINNAYNVMSLEILTVAGECAMAEKKTARARVFFEQGYRFQKDLQYDEPAPFYYPIGETYAGILLGLNTPEALEEAEDVLRTVLFQWPRSALASYAMSAVLSAQGKTTAAAFAMEGATAVNDTALSLEFL